MPNHDNLKGENIINSIGALHSFKKNKNSIKKFNINNQKLVSCIIGGK